MANNIFTGKTNAFVARQTATFAAAGFDASNTSIIYLVDNPLKSWKPGRTINSLTGFEVGKGYIIEALASADKSVYLIPPFTQSLAAPASFTAVPANTTTNNLTWASDGLGTGFVIEFSLDSGTTWGNLATKASSDTSHSHTGLAPTTTVQYRIKKTGNGSTVADSAYATATATTYMVFDNFQSGTIGQLPAGWAGSGAAVASSGVSGEKALSLFQNGALNQLFYNTKDTNAGNVQIEVKFLGQLQGGVNWGLIARSNNNSFTAAGGNYYYLNINVGSTVVTNGIMLRKRINTGTPVDLAPITGVLINAVLYKVILVLNGSQIGYKVQRLTDNYWLTSTNQWQPAEVFVVNITDTQITGAGFAGLFLFTSDAGTSYFDDFAISKI